MITTNVFNDVLEAIKASRHKECINAKIITSESCKMYRLSPV